MTEDVGCVVETGQGDDREAAVDHAGLRTLEDGGEIEDARVGQMQRRDEGAAGAVCWQVYNKLSQLLRQLVLGLVLDLVQSRLGLSCFFIS